MYFGKVITAMVTPMQANGEVDYDKAQKLAEHLYKNGSKSIVVSGTTGESPTLTKQEKLKLFRAVKEVADNKGMVIAGAGCNNTEDSCSFGREAAACGVDGILSVVPYYNKPSQEGLYQHFKCIAEAVEIPVVLYNIPLRTGINMEAQTVARLSEIGNIVALKEASGNMEQVSKLKQLLDDDFYIYSGDDSCTLPMLSLGCTGVISVASHIVGNEIHDMIEIFQTGNTAAAAQMHKRLYPAFSKLFITSNPVPVKYCVSKLGFDCGPCRLPLVAPTDEQKKVLDDMLLALDVAPINIAF